MRPIVRSSAVRSVCNFCRWSAGHRSHPQRARWDKLSDLPILELAGLVELLLIALLLARSLVSDLWNGLAHEKRIVCGSGQAGTSYDYHSLLSRNPKEIIVVAQNMRTLLSDKDYLPSISMWLARNKNGASLTFILSTPKLLGAHSPKAKEHLSQSAIDLKGFLEKEPLREMINIRFHPGANSLSAFFCDPKSRESGNRSVYAKVGPGRGASESIFLRNRTLGARGPF